MPIINSVINNISGLIESMMKSVVAGENPVSTTELSTIETATTNIISGE